MNKSIFCLMILMVLSIVFSFDSLISSLSVMPFRLIYDFAFSMITFVFIYISFCLILGEEPPQKSLSLFFPKILITVPIALNISSLTSIILLENPDIGFLLENTLTQASMGLSSLLKFIAVSAANAIVLYLIIHREIIIQLFEIPTYLLAIIAIKTSLSIYAFYINGINGIRWVLSLYHASFILLTLKVNRLFEDKKIQLKVESTELFLALLSIGIFMMTYAPFGLYNLYADNAIILGSALSIVKRESLEPYYLASKYYSPIAGFIAVIFSYETMLSNLLLSSNLPFLATYITLPFVIYHFIKSFIIDDSRLIIVATIAASLMDGLAIVLLPLYEGKLTENIINWRISPLTGSLYASNICHLWLTPYKIFANVSAIAACSVLHKQHPTNFLLSGVLFFVSLANPRYSILTILLFWLLFKMKKISTRNIILFLLSVIISSGPTFLTHLYKGLYGLFWSLCKIGLIDEKSFSSYINLLELFLIHENSPLIAMVILMAFLGLILMFCLDFTKKRHRDNDNNIYASKFSARNMRDSITIKVDRIKKEIKISCFKFTVLSIMLAIFMYVVFHAYLIFSIERLINSPFIAILNIIIVRYHVLTAFFIAVFFTLKCDKKIAFTSLTFFIFFLFGGMVSMSTSLLPIVFVVLASPLLSFIAKQKEKIIMAFFLLFIFSGVFSSTFYSATIKSIQITEYNDLPNLLSILIKCKENTYVYSPSSYKYFVYRVIRMAHLNLSSDSSSHIYIIDRDYTKKEIIDALLNNNNFTLVYLGCKFILLERLSSNERK
ncbi:MAG: hypothetical protein QXR45_12385 [Candidatus Bathyarchaeia archaeon]